MKTMKELLNLPQISLSHGHSWGAWKLDAKRLVLLFRDGYEIDLETINSSAEMLDWIFQVQCWTRPQEMADLLHAFLDIFNPQRNLCCGGGDLRIENPKEFLRQRIAR